MRGWEVEQSFQQLQGCQKTKIWFRELNKSCLVNVSFLRVIHYIRLYPKIKCSQDYTSSPPNWSPVTNNKSWFVIVFTVSTCMAENSAALWRKKHFPMPQKYLYNLYIHSPAVSRAFSGVQKLRLKKTRGKVTIETDAQEIQIIKSSNEMLK